MAGSPVRLADTLSCYTNGSRIGGRTGAAYYTLCQSTSAGEGKYGLAPLGTSATVFQAEIVAIVRLADHLATLDIADKPVNIYVDSLSSLHSLTSALATGRLVRDCFDSLSKLAENCQVTLNWIPAHSGYSGNKGC